ncbi:uncharacterized protein LOC131650190 [Vicia villosa]|uniref:uncharacterized protein LOC131650190 n=1 Tax=Vicia villosa TaxID=3911 RepID=UPI00273CD2B8|nr:uncharacterized protein LOC131650190 [Vicia villosa]
MPSLAAAVSRSSNNMDPEFLRARAFIQDKICDVLLHRSNTPNSEMQKRRIKDLAKRLEEAMLKTALSKHEIQVGLVDDLRKRNEELDEMTKERDRLSKWVEELESAACPAEDETEEEKTLSTRAQLIFDREYLLSGQAPPIKEVNAEEPLFPALPILNAYFATKVT